MSVSDILKKAFEQFVGVKVEARSQGFTRRCTLSGSVTVRYTGSTAGGTATLNNTEVVFTGCTYPWNNRTATFHATLRANGTWRASRPADPVRLEGEIRIDEIGGPFLLNGTTGPFLNGTIVRPPETPGGTPGETVTIGVPTTPTNPGTPPPSGTPTVPSAPPVAPGTPAPTVNLTGTWGVDGQPSISLIQNGGTVSGQFLLPEIPIPGGIQVLRNGLHGFVGGSTVHFTGVLEVRAGDSDGSMTMLVYSSGVLDLIGGALSGEVVTEPSARCTGFMIDVCPPATAPQAGRVTLTRIGAVQSGSYDVSGRWAGTEMLQLSQGGTSISGSVVGADIAEQSVSGSNDNNRVTLRVRFTTRENTSSVDYSRTVERLYELTAYEPSSMGGFVTSVTTERCTAKSSSAASFCADRNKTERTAGNAMLMRR
jgi:hypothetical protein